MFYVSWNGAESESGSFKGMSRSRNRALREAIQTYQYQLELT